MKGLFQNTGARAPARPGESRLSLAAFGKHPGWDDHISGIGVETEVLAHIKQSLYVGGIGRQIDLGAWEKLDAAKRVEGFDHTFFWFRAGHVVLGRFWSSTDRKGRAKYPMVLCVDSEGLEPGFLLARGGAELERLRETCKATNSAEQVTAECGAAQERLRALLESAAQGPAEMAVEAEQKQRFLESPALGPNRVGMLRVVHELDNALGASSTNRATGAAALAQLRPYHIRVPLGVGAPNEALLVWAEFLRGALPHSVPLMLIARNGVNWLDVIVGEPSGDDFFCLQASPQALPLATEIPYELGPDLGARLQEMEALFLAADAAANTGGTIFIKKTAAAAPADAGQGEAPAPRRRKGWFWLVIGVVVIGAAGAGVYFALPGPDKKYQSHIQAAQGALDAKNLALATQEADAALQFKPQDPAAIKLKGEVEKRQREAAALGEIEQKYQQAISAARGALGRQDYLATVAQADAALAIKPNDATAAKLKSDAQARQSEAATQEENDGKYKQTVAAANAAFAQQDYKTTVMQADAALAARPNDPIAAKLRNDAKARLDELVARLESDRKFQLAMTSAQAAFAQRDYATAITQADAALAIKPNDATIAKLKSDAQARVREIAAQAETDRKYKGAMASAQTALNQQDYATALAQLNAALGIKPGDSEATQLLSQAQQKKTLQEQAALAAKQASETPTPPAPASQPQPVNTASATTTAATTSAAQLNNTGTQGGTIDNYDRTLRNLMIQLHVKPQGPNILTNGGTAQPLLRGFLPADSIDQYVKDVENLRKVYQAHNWLDAERKKDLKLLNDAILDWNQ